MGKDYGNNVACTKIIYTETECTVIIYLTIRTMSYTVGCYPGLPKASPACQAGHLAWPGRPDRDLTGRQAGIHPLFIINY